MAFYVDDWGSVRTKDKAAYSYLLSKGVPMDDRFSRKDTLANEDDLTALFEVLDSVKDCNGRPACFTSVMNPANPDFDQIKRNDFRVFYNEPFTTTLRKYGKGYENTFDLWKEGIGQGFFYPIFHGTEHISRKKWMEALQSRHEPTHWAFECDSVGIPNVPGYTPVHHIMQPYYIDTPEDNELLQKQISEGIEMFTALFNFRPRQFKAGGDIISPELYPALANYGIEYMDEPLYTKRHTGSGKYVKVFNHTGKINSIGQKVLVRNAMFEPTNNIPFDSVGNCLKLINAAFFFQKPAIISSHRVNYMGALDEKNREEGLKQLLFLLKEIVKRWPDVEFVNADQVGDIIYQNNA